MHCIFLAVARGYATTLILLMELPSISQADAAVVSRGENGLKVHSLYPPSRHCEMEDPGLVCLPCTGLTAWSVPNPVPVAS